MLERLGDALSWAGTAVWVAHLAVHMVGPCRPRRHHAMLCTFRALWACSIVAEIPRDVGLDLAMDVVCGGVLCVLAVRSYREWRKHRDDDDDGPRRRGRTAASRRFREWVERHAPAPLPNPA